MSSEEMPLIVFGAGGHAAVIVDLVQLVQPNRKLHIFDEAQNCAPVLGHHVKTGFPDPKALPAAKYKVVVGIGNTNSRKTVSEKLGELGYSFATLVHPNACIGAMVSLGQGTVIFAKAVVNPRAILSQGCIVNTSAVIEHDCNVGDYCHIGPGAVVAGASKIGAHTWIGANATVREACIIGPNVIVGAGSFVHKNLVADATYVGSPVRQIK